MGESLHDLLLRGFSWFDLVAIAPEDRADVVKNVLSWFPNTRRVGAIFVGDGGGPGHSAVWSASTALPGWAYDCWDGAWSRIARPDLPHVIIESPTSYKGWDSEVLGWVRHNPAPVSKIILTCRTPLELGVAQPRYATVTGQPDS